MHWARLGAAPAHLDPQIRRGHGLRLAQAAFAAVPRAPVLGLLLPLLADAALRLALLLVLGDLGQARLFLMPCGLRGRRATR